LVKRAAAGVELDPAKYSGHSLRAGLVTAAHDAGAADSTIMQTTGHKSVQTLTRYMRSGRPFAQAAARGLL
jgi:integrase